jgi:hypothetical protein
MTGYHYHNPRDPNDFAENGGEAFLRNTLLYNLKFGTVELPPTLEEQKAGIPSKTVTMRELGISHPVLLYVHNVVPVSIINPDLPSPLPSGIVIDPDLQASLSGSGGGGGSMGGSQRSQQTGGAAGPSQVTLRQFAMSRGVRDPVLTVRRFDFVIQFAWEVTPPSVRKQNAESATGYAN